MDNDYYIITSEMPGWLRQGLASGGIPREFILSDLTREQRKCLIIYESIVGLVEKGLMEVKYNPKTDDAPHFRLTKKGLKVNTKLLEKATKKYKYL